MILLHYQTDEGPRLAVKTKDGVFDARGASLDQVFLGATPSHGDRLDESRLVYAPSVPNPGKILCIGLNYRKHAEETGATLPKAPILFAKFGNTVAASGDEVPIPKATEQMDYEAELVVVIGRETRNVTVEEASGHIWGYTNGNDFSARDLQHASPQWTLGKTPDKFGPLGPWLVSSQELGDLGPRAITCTVNGDLRQNSNLGDLIFSAPEIVSYLSRYFTLSPGDVIFTGTPNGVALGYPDPKPWLHAGDEVVVEIEGLGKLTNRLVEGV
jgi:2-keto-4-pentenoate hydratase/2-oxohepta-3-ene-1,7-dioic acid hydratase in catechol pathway